MNRILITITTLLIWEMPMLGQNLTFRSVEFEAGIRQHLKIANDDVLTNIMLDTITVVDLSGMGITSIQDVELLPNVRYIDLSHNEIDDIAPLALLDSLRYVNLSHNVLKNINLLTFSQSEEMSIDVSFNYIDDFSCFNSITPCIFSIAGAGLQQNNDAPYLDVYQLYADVDDEGFAKICYRGITNMETDVTLKCGTLQVAAQMDGHTNSVPLPEIDATMKAVLSNGEVGDTTYVVPQYTHIVEGGGEVTIDSELPENYQVGYLRVLHGNVEAVGTTLHYTAPATFTSDTIYMSYYEENRFKGFTQMYIMSKDICDDINTPQQESSIKMSLNGSVLTITAPVTQKDGVVAVKVYDVLGRNLATKTQWNGQNMVITLPKNQPVVIVELNCAGRHLVRKVASQ